MRIISLYVSLIRERLLDMKSLYQWLQDEKGYSWEEASETVIRYEQDMDIPDDVKRDIKKYTEEFIQRYHS